jgi:hypothetical protein
VIEVVWAPPVLRTTGDRYHGSSTLSPGGLSAKVTFRMGGHDFCAAANEYTPHATKKIKISYRTSIIIAPDPGADAQRPTGLTMLERGWWPADTKVEIGLALLEEKRRLALLEDMRK